MKLLDFKGRAEDLKTNLHRFPITSGIVYISVLIALFLVEFDGFSSDGYIFLYKLLMTCELGALLSLGIYLFFENHNVEKKNKTVIYALLGLFLVSYYYFLPGIGEFGVGMHFIRFMLLSLSFFSFVLIGPFIQKKNNLNLWLFSRSVISRMITGFFFALVLFIGIAISLAAIENLFDVDIYDNLYQHIFILIYGVFFSNYFLFGLAKDCEKLDHEYSLGNGLKTFARYVLLPLMTIFFLILAAYIVKIIVSFGLPEEKVAFFIILFSFIALFNNLILYPYVQKSDQAFFVLYRKINLILLLPFIGVLLWALIVRINQYGFTELRYFLVLYAVWFLCLIFYFLKSKEKLLKFIFASFSIILILAIYGPMSAFNVSIRSQLNIGDNVLEANQLNPPFEKGSLSDLSDEDKKTLDGSWRYLINKHGLKTLEGYYNEDAYNAYTVYDLKCGSDYSCFSKFLGFELNNVVYPVEDDIIRVNSNSSNSIKVSGYDFITTRLWYSDHNDVKDGVYVLFTNENAEIYNSGELITKIGLVEFISKYSVPEVNGEMYDEIKLYNDKAAILFEYINFKEGLLLNAEYRVLYN